MHVRLVLSKGRPQITPNLSLLGTVFRVCALEIDLLLVYVFKKIITKLFNFTLITKIYMKNNKDSLKSSSLYLTTAAFMVAVIITISLPVLSYAASYAYVHNSGEVRMVTADNYMQAIATAPNIAERSGVLLLDSSNDNSVVGDQVSGI